MLSLLFEESLTLLLGETFIFLKGLFGGCVNAELGRFRVKSRSFLKELRRFTGVFKELENTEFGLGLGFMPDEPKMPDSLPAGNAGS